MGVPEIKEWGSWGLGVGISGPGCRDIALSRKMTPTPPREASVIPTPPPSVRLAVSQGRLWSNWTGLGWLKFKLYTGASAITQSPGPAQENGGVGRPPWSVMKVTEEALRKPPFLS